MEQTTTHKINKDWFKDWFDSPYYHILYRERDEEEAEQFVGRLLEYLQPEPGAKMLDLACGKGRYSRYLAALGYTVTGLDISPRSIAYARQFETENLSFYTHDMRQVFRTNYFDFIFNIFTSFGYFDNEYDHVRTLKTVAAGLKPNGTFILDYFNSVKVIRDLPEETTKTIDGIEFKIKKWVVDDHIYKSIRFEVNGEKIEFTEKVKAFGLQEFQYLLDKAGIRIVDYFGDYYLSEFDVNQSNRLIIAGQLKEAEVIYGQD